MYVHMNMQLQLPPECPIDGSTCPSECATVRLFYVSINSYTIYVHSFVQLSWCQ